MKTFLFKTLVLAQIMFFSIPAVSQEKLTINATYDGHDENGYNFIMSADDGGNDYITFLDIEQSVLKEFNLKSEEFIGIKFEVTYVVETVTEEDEDGEEQDITILMIVALKK